MCSSDLYDKSVLMVFSSINQDLETLPFFSRRHLPFVHNESMNTGDHDYNCIAIDRNCFLTNNEEGAFGFLSDGSECFANDIHN